MGNAWTPKAGDAVVVRYLGRTRRGIIKSIDDDGRISVDLAIPVGAFGTVRVWPSQVAPQPVLYVRAADGTTVRMRVR